MSQFNFTKTNRMTCFVSPIKQRPKQEKATQFYENLRKDPEFLIHNVWGQAVCEAVQSNS